VACDSITIKKSVLLNLYLLLSNDIKFIKKTRFQHVSARQLVHGGLGHLDLVGGLQPGRIGVAHDEQPSF
jgi:hypothetical protein